MKRLFMILALSAVLLVDRILKQLVRQGFEATAGPIHLSHYRNDGLVFSLPAPYWVTVGLMLLAGVAIIVVAWRQRHRLPSWWPLGLLAIGAVSNVYDRLVYGYIVDYVFVSRWWPIFNVADVALMIGMIWFLWTASVDKRSRLPVV